MTAPDVFSFRPEQFSGVARLFPLPNLVLFPHVMQPLRIFEPRYRELLEDALDDDGLIAMALLKPGWEEDYEGQPPIEPVVCLGRVLRHCRLPEGHYNVLLLGLQRATIRCELPLTRSFRRAKLRLLRDRCAPVEAAGRPALRRQLLERFRRVLPSDAELREELEPLLGKRLSLGVLTDIVAFTLGFDVETKQRLLSVCDVDERARLLLTYLRAWEEDLVLADTECPTFPPQFSWN
jgi:uncharacterized protein